MTPQIFFKRALLAAFALITKPGKYELEVMSNVTEANLVTDEEGENPRYIATLKAIPQDKIVQLRETFSEAEEVEIEKTNGLFLTANIWVKAGVSPDLPMKGEKVEVTINEVPSREGEPVLRATNIKRKPAEIAKKVDLLTFFKEQAEETEQAVSIPSQGEIVHS